MLSGAGDCCCASVGADLPFFGNVTGNIMALVKSLGDAGLVGLIALGVILWLFSGPEKEPEARPQQHKERFRNDVGW